MMCNVGTTDRWVRFMLGIVIIGGTLYFVDTRLPKTLLLALAIFFIATAGFGVCHLYKMLGISTAKPAPLEAK
jgi:hypothetical protein